MTEWGPWVALTLRCMDGDGAYQCLPFSGGICDQPALHMDIMDIIKSRINEMKKMEMEKSRVK